MDYLKMAREARERQLQKHSTGEEAPNHVADNSVVAEETPDSPSEDNSHPEVSENHEGNAPSDEGLEGVPNTSLPGENEAAARVVTILQRVFEDEPEYADERDPEVLINAVASHKEMYFVPTLDEMVQAMKQKGLQPLTISDAEVIMRRLLREPVPTETHPILTDRTRKRINLVQVWVATRGNMYQPFPADDQKLEAIGAARKLQDEGHFADDTSDEEVAEVLGMLVKEQKRANLRNKRYQRERAAREPTPPDTSAEPYQEDEFDGRPDPTEDAPDTPDVDGYW